MIIVAVFEDRVVIGQNPLAESHRRKIRLSDFAQQGAQVFQAGIGPPGHLHFNKPLKSPCLTDNCVIKPLGGLGAYFIDQQQNTKPAQAVIRVGQNPHMGQRVFDMGRLHKFEAAVLDEGDAFTRQFDFEVERMEAGPEENGDFAIRYPVTTDLTDLVDDKTRLAVFAARMNQTGGILGGSTGK